MVQQALSIAPYDGCDSPVIEALSVSPTGASLTEMSVASDCSGIIVARQLTGLSRAELARAAGLSEQTLLRLEMGVMEATPAILSSVSRALGVKVTALTSPHDIEIAAALFADSAVRA